MTGIGSGLSCRTKKKERPAVTYNGPAILVWSGLARTALRARVVLFRNGLAGTRIQKEPITRIILVLTEVEHLRDGVRDCVK